MGSEMCIRDRFGTEDLLKGLQNTSTETLEMFGMIIQRLPDLMKQYNEDPQKAVYELLNELKGLSGEMAQKQLEEAKKQTSLLDKLKEGWNALKVLFPELELYNVAAKAPDEVFKAASSLFRDLKAGFAQLKEWKAYQKAPRGVWRAGKTEAPMPPDFGAIFKNFGSQIVNIFSSLAQPISTALLPLLQSSEALLQVLSPISTILGAMMEILSPVLDELLIPLVGILKVIGITLGKMLVPVLKMLTPVIQMLATAFIWFYNKVIVPIANTLIDIAASIYNAIAKVWNWIADVINKTLGWAGIHISKMEEMDAAAMKLEEIDMADLVYGMGEDAAKTVGELAVREKESEGRERRRGREI